MPTADDPTGTHQAVRQVKEQFWAPTLADAAVCRRWWKGTEVLIVTGATTDKAEANDTAVKYIKRTARLQQSGQLRIASSLGKCRPVPGMTLIPGIHFPTNGEEPPTSAWMSPQATDYRQAPPSVRPEARRSLKTAPWSRRRPEGRPR